MKTAMQELLDHLESYDMNINTEFYKGLLEKEKEQIKDAWDAGMSEGIGTTMADLDYDREFINYYKQTYNQNK